jgi:excisionase family DNA binding protein
VGNAQHVVVPANHKGEAMPIAEYAVRELRAILREWPDLLTVQDVAMLTDSHERTVRRWLEEGRLAGLRKGNRAFLIPQAALVKFLTEADD